MSYFKIFRMAAGALFWALALLSPAGVSSQTLELSGAQVVTSGDDPLVRKAAEVLVDELALRTGVTLSAAGTADGVQILIGRESDLAAGNAALGRELGALPPTGTEGYKLLVAEDGKCVVVAGNDPRGVLYGVGRLLAPQRLEALLSGRVGRVLKMESADVHKASDWFAAHGWPSVFYCRCIPILRSLISIPAGMAGMHPAPFLLLTTVGSLLWNILLVYLGALAGQSWPAVTAALEQASGWVKAVLVVACAAGVSALFYGRRKKREAARQCAVPEREETQKEK